MNSIRPFRLVFCLGLLILGSSYQYNAGLPLSIFTSEYYKYLLNSPKGQFALLIMPVLIPLWLAGAAANIFAGRKSNVEAEINALALNAERAKQARAND